MFVLRGEHLYTETEAETEAEAETHLTHQSLDVTGHALEVLQDPEVEAGARDLHDVVVVHDQVDFEWLVGGATQFSSVKLPVDHVSDPQAYTEHRAQRKQGRVLSQTNLLIITFSSSHVQVCGRFL